ncbi:hypothetical protein TWF696_006137 [Orbilia brochopaga]|uniref:Cytosolic endo-beta-N-acetylglucosaminidase TIM barrel domain-containing protein n=1 Tax=Orbilia brochopaga TaxID=3140254 RepID=A0AAV9UVA4_9PEZI
MRYFDDLASVRAWRPDQDRSRGGDAADIANVPFQQRPKPIIQNGFKLLVCHDFKGAYLPYEDSQGIFSSDTFYTLEYTHLVSTFVYFSHHRVTIPPAPWVNMMHRNGVRVLGTLPFEGGDQKNKRPTDIHNILDTDPQGNYIFAKLLAKIAKYYGFDGWLLNFEAEFPQRRWSPYHLLNFVKKLKLECEALVKGSEVIWYDSLTIWNKVDYKNGLSPDNSPLFKVASGFYSNYQWTAAQLLETRAISTSLGRNHDVYMGIDVFGRGTFGGGGWGIGTALSAIRDHCLSAAVFAPGWTFEHFNGLQFEERNRKLWIDGRAADPELPCRPIKDYVPVWPVGTEQFFYTNFNRGFGKKWFMEGRQVSSEPWVHIGAQSILPTFYPAKFDRLVWAFDDQLAYNGGHSLKIVRNQLESSGSKGLVCKLYRLGLDYSQNIRLSFSYQLKAAHKGHVAVYFILANYLGVPERHDFGLPVYEEGWKSQTLILDVGKTKDERFGMKLVEFGVAYVDTDQPDGERVDTTVLHLGHVCFSTHPEPRLPAISKVLSLRVASGKLRLSWVPEYIESGFTAEMCLQPGVKSMTTFNFAYFVVYRGLGQFLGISHCLEFWAEEGAQDGTFRVDGVSFDGRVVTGPWYT